MTTRRTALAMLGLAPTSAAATEMFLKDDQLRGKPESVSEAWSNDAAANAFEQLALAIRAGTVHVRRLDYRSVLAPDVMANLHELKVDFFYLPDSIA